ncbi:filamentous hemagglutinin N-terminal domain-containing protein [Escherichia coli]
MNRNCYRIIFNKARGMLMVVADIARSGRAGTSLSSRTGYPHRQCICRVTPLAFSLWLASGMVHSVSAAGIVADHGAPGHQQPTITQTASGIPQVNIQTPSAGGVSHNTYSQFDVGNQGVILNNAHNNVQTQLGGMVAGNPWLARGEARIILNEVNSRNPSQLNGFVEVAGKKAQVVIANPAGISCDGCGFINANRATLTTGQPQMKNGSLTGFSVERGEIQITGKGMDASRTDYTDIIARSVKINAGIWAQDLKVTTGRNNVDIAHGQIEKKTGDVSSQPQMALDVASLGGMYAGKIRLVGTETGVGVRNAGHIGAQAGAVTLTADGRIENSGSISAKTDVHLATTRELHNSGSVYAGQDTQIQSDGVFTHTGSVASRRNTRIQTARLTGGERSLLAAGVKDDGRLAAAGNLTVSTTGELAAHGQVLSGGDMQLKGQGLDLGNSRIQGQHTELNATSGNLSTQNAQLSAGTLSARTAGQFSNNGGTINADTLQISAQSLSNRKGSLIQTGTGDFSLSLPGNVDKGSEKGNGTTHTETTVDAGNRLTIISGRDTTLTGAQAGGETVKVDAGRHLTLTSEQDSDRYDSKQQNASAGGSFTFGSMSGSASVSLSRDKMHSNYDSVQEQTGIFAGRGGFDVTTGQHTQLNGAVIASTATADKNRLDTGTLGFSDIENRADFKTEHQSAGLSTGGSVAGNFLGNMANNLLVGANHEGHADSTTQSAVSAGNITIRDTQSQKQDVADLNRDAAHANQTLSPIFDREKEQQRLQQAQLIGEIGNQVADIARTEGQIAGEKAKRDPAALNQARAELEAAGKPFTEQDVAQRAYNNGMAASGFGTGGKYQQAIQAATAAVQGLAGGNLSAALAGGAAPYIAEIIKQTTPDGAGRVAAHAVVNAALAVAQGNNALAGAAGAATGEVVGMIATQMYGKPVNELSETEKQTVSTLATVAAGLAGGLVGDSGASAVAGAQSGKTTVENNALSLPSGMVSYGQAVASWNQYADANNLTPEQKQAGLDKLAKGELPDGANISKVIVDGYKDGVLIAGAWYLGPAASVGKVIGGGVIAEIANGTYQWFDLSQPGNENKNWDWKSSASAGITGMLAPGRTVGQNVGIAMGSAFFTDGPNAGAIGGAAAGAWAGGLFGEYAPGIVNSVTGKGIPGFVYDYWGGVASEFSSGFIKDLNKPKGSSEDKKK